MAEAWPGVVSVNHHQCQPVRSVWERRKLLVELSSRCCCIILAKALRGGGCVAPDPSGGCSAVTC